MYTCTISVRYRLKFYNVPLYHVQKRQGQEIEVKITKARQTQGLFLQIPQEEQRQVQRQKQQGELG